MSDRAKRWLMRAFIAAALIYFGVSEYGRSQFSARCVGSGGISVQGYGRLICITDQPVIAEQ